MPFSVLPDYQTIPTSNESAEINQGYMLPRALELPG